MGNAPASGPLEIRFVETQIPVSDLEEVQVGMTGTINLKAFQKVSESRRLKWAQE